MEATAAWTTETAQQVVDEIVEIAVATEVDVHAGCGSPAHASGLVPVLAELLITTPLLGVGEHFVGLTDLLEPRFSLGITRVDVRVVLARQAAKGFLDGIGIGAAINTEHLEIVLVSAACHTHPVVIPVSPQQGLRCCFRMEGSPNA